jgi:hypothetical protein
MIFGVAIGLIGADATAISGFCLVVMAVAISLSFDETRGALAIGATFVGGFVGFWGILLLGEIRDCRTVDAIGRSGLR